MGPFNPISQALSGGAEGTSGATGVIGGVDNSSSKSYKLSISSP